MDNKVIKITFSKDALKTFDDIKSLSTMTSNEEIIKNALRMLAWYVDMRNKGVKLQIEKPDGTVKEIEFLF